MNGRCDRCGKTLSTGDYNQLCRACDDWLEKNYPSKASKAVNLIADAVHEFDPSKLKQPEINLDRLGALDVAWYCFMHQTDCKFCNIFGGCDALTCPLLPQITDRGDSMDADFHAT